MLNLITISGQENQLVSARELYNGLGLARDQFRRWSTRNIINNVFWSENVDYIIHDQRSGSENPIDYYMSIEMAKHLAMMSQSVKAQEYRNYMIAKEQEVIHLKQQLFLETQSKLEIANKYAELFHEHKFTVDSLRTIINGSTSDVYNILGSQGYFERNHNDIWIPTAETTNDNLVYMYEYDFIDPIGKKRKGRKMLLTELGYTTFKCALENYQ